VFFPASALAQVLAHIPPQGPGSGSCASQPCQKFAFTPPAFFLTLPLPVISSPTLHSMPLSCFTKA